MSTPTDDPAATGHPADLPPPSTASVDARPVTPKHVAVELADIFSHTGSSVIIKTSCEFYGIHMHDNEVINRARLSLHIVGVTSDGVGKEKWDELAERLTHFINTCDVTNTPTVGHLNKHGPILFPNAWIPCISTVEGLRQCIKRLLDEHRIPIPRDSLDLRGMEGPRPPSFRLHGCFEHLLSDREDKVTRFSYIEKALSSWGVYPKSCLFQEMGTILGNILTGPVVAQEASPWNKARVLTALGMGVELKDRSGRSTGKFILHPWGIELGPTFDIDFHVSMWIGKVITSAYVEGRRRMEGPSEARRETAPSSSVEEGESGYDGDDDLGWAGEARNKRETATTLAFQCETCQMGEEQWPCKVDVVWGSYVQNTHLMEQDWADRVLENGKCKIVDVEGTSHMLILRRDVRQYADTTTLDSRKITELLLKWRSDKFGSISMLEALDKADNIKFQLEDQHHWLDESKTKLIPQVSRSIDVTDTSGKKYTIIRPDPLAENKLEAFEEWKEFLAIVSLRLMGVDAVDQFEVDADPLWTLCDVTPRPRPIIWSQIPLDEFDWNYGPDPSQTLEDHLAKLRDSD